MIANIAHLLGDQPVTEGELGAAHLNHLGFLPRFVALAAGRSSSQLSSQIASIASFSS
jgi:hypothetical protein